MHKLCLKQKALSTKGDFGMKSWRVARLFSNSKGDSRLRTQVILIKRGISSEIDCVPRNFGISSNESW